MNLHTVINVVKEACGCFSLVVGNCCAAGKKILIANVLVINYIQIVFYTITQCLDKFGVYEMDLFS